MGVSRQQHTVAPPPHPHSTPHSHSVTSADFIIIVATTAHHPLPTCALLTSSPPTTSTPTTLLPSPPTTREILCYPGVHFTSCIYLPSNGKRTAEAVPFGATYPIPIGIEHPAYCR
jgi:hypothetical protein